MRTIVRSVLMLAVVAAGVGVGTAHVGVAALLGPSVLVPIVPVHATRLQSARSSSRRRSRVT